MESFFSSNRHFPLPRDQQRRRFRESSTGSGFTCTLELYLDLVNLDTTQVSGASCRGVSVVVLDVLGLGNLRFYHHITIISVLVYMIVAQCLLPGCGPQASDLVCFKSDFNTFHQLR
jgi:hypothetical protein